MPDCPVEETGSILRLLLDSTGDVVSGGGFLRALSMLFEEVGAPRDAFKRLKSDNSLGEGESGNVKFDETGAAKRGYV